MQPRTLKLGFDRAGVDELSAAFLAADTESNPDQAERESAVLLACGAGSSMDSPFLVRVAEGLASRGLPVLRFHYAYRDRAIRAGKRMGRPDRTVDLEAAHETALAELRRLCPGKRAILAGKSLGGRIATHLAAKGADCAALALFGYPLHPAGKPDRLRQEHFPAIAQPALFLQGTRDKLCDLELLRPALETFGGPTRLVVVAGADHGFGVLKSTGRTDGEVLLQLVDELDRWEATGFPPDQDPT